VGITRIGHGSKAFEISDVTAEEAVRIALAQAGIQKSRQGWLARLVKHGRKRN
jgi:hypothetical protein